MSTIRLSRYTVDHYYFELWQGGAVVQESGQPQCGDFTPADLEDFVGVYDGIVQVLVCDPDLLERKSDTRTTLNARPTYEENERLFEAAMRAGLAFHNIVEEYNK